MRRSRQISKKNNLDTQASLKKLLATLLSKMILITQTTLEQSKIQASNQMNIKAKLEHTITHSKMNSQGEQT